jgi:hypothetical protein
MVDDAETQKAVTQSMVNDAETQEEVVTQSVVNDVEQQLTQIDYNS